jgi:hypothetical protein
MLPKGARGAGDVVSATLAKVGVKSCGACRRRAEKLNGVLQLAPKKRSSGKKGDASA